MKAKKKICHEGVSASLDVTKAKVNLAKNFFWPTCYKDVEEYVRSWNDCQRVDDPIKRKGQHQFWTFAAVPYNFEVVHRRGNCMKMAIA